MKLRKFKILSVEIIPGGAGPEYMWAVKYRAIKNKVWVEDSLFIIARNKNEAYAKAHRRFGGIN